MKTVYAIVSISYDYNDEIYFASEDNAGTPVMIFNKKEDAENKCFIDNLSAARQKVETDQQDDYSYEPSKFIDIFYAKNLAAIEHIDFEKLYNNDDMSGYRNDCMRAIIMFENFLNYVPSSIYRGCVDKHFDNVFLVKDFKIVSVPFSG